MATEKITIPTEGTMKALFTTDFHMVSVDSSTAMEIITKVMLSLAEEMEKEATVQAISPSAVSLRTMCCMAREKK